MPVIDRTRLVKVPVNRKFVTRSWMWLIYLVLTMFCVTTFILTFWKPLNDDMYILETDNNNDTMAMKSTNLAVFLEKYKHRTDKEIILVPNPGNAGDTLILYGTILLFDYVGIKYKFGDYRYKYKNSILFYSGGGNFIDKYHHCLNFFKNNFALNNRNEIILLPQTIKNQSIIKQFGENIILFAREIVSYNYIRNVAKYIENTKISKDLAFYIGDIQTKTNPITKYRNKDSLNHSEEKILNAYRIDDEKTNKIIPNNNVDVSRILKKPYSSWFNNTNKVEQIVENVFEYISKYDTIYTNRLHIGIASSLLNKKCFLGSNSYYKNEAIFNYSIKNKFKKTVFVK